MRTVAVFRMELLRPSETFILAQASALRKYAPTFVGLRRVRPSLSLPGREITLTSIRSFARLRTKMYMGVQVAPLFYRRVARIGASLVHAHFAPDGAVATRLAEKLGTPILVTLHGYDVTVKTNFRGRYADLWRKADRFLCVSEFIRRKAIEAGFPEEKLLVHYIGIDCKRFVPTEGGRAEGMVLFVGRLVEKKGCQYLLDAMQQVQRRCADASLVIIGDGPLRKPLEAHAGELRLNCTFLGRQPTEVVRSYLQAASVLCVPSVTAANGDSEGLPIALLEGMAMGVPIVGSRHAGIPEAVVDGETGLLANERDVSQLAKHLLRSLKDKPFTNVSTRRGRELVLARFDHIRQTAILEDIYDSVVADG